MRIPHVTSAPVLGLFAIALAWLALVISSPLIVPNGTLTDLSGVVGGHENDDQFAPLSSVPRAVYWLGDAECHQLANRSYFLNDNQMPFCARDLGIFVGLAAGFGLMAFFRYKVHPVILLAGLVPIGIDGGLQQVTDYESTNTLRIVTGTVAGVVLALLFAHFLFIVQEDREKRRPAPEAEASGGEPGQG
ncbi:MAG: hypothetical protein A3K67_04095 [Euryarchaeota archaeon RBG_16_62_10]|nr:MAG: hypothetical protein A3K67_04095 [Euryarchaeota archaeon RBG_16_62_10]